MLAIAALFTFNAVSGSDLSDMLVQTMAVSPVISMNAYSGKYKKDIFSTLYNDMEVWGDITPNTGIKSKLTFTKLDVNDGVRPYVGQEQITGDELTYTGTELAVELGQRDLQIEIKKYYNSHLEEELAKSEGSGAKQKTLPFAVKTINTVLGRLRSELNDKTAYFGFRKADATAYSAGATYAVNDYITFNNGQTTDYYKCLDATTAGQSPTTHPAKWQMVNAEAICPGFGWHLQQLINAGKLTPTNIGTIDNSAVHAYDAHKELFRSHDVPYKNAGVIHYCSYTDFELLLDSIEDKVAKYTEKDSVWVNDRGIYLPQTNRKCLVLPCSWMGDSRRIISTPKANMHGGTDRTHDMNEIKTRDKDNYNIVSSVTFTLGFAIQDPAAVRINEKA